MHSFPSRCCIGNRVLEGCEVGQKALKRQPINFACGYGAFGVVIYCVRVAARLGLFLLGTLGVK